MGRPKGLLHVSGCTLVEAHVGALQQRASRLVVVLGPDPDAYSSVLPPFVQRVHNTRWQHTWPADSLHLALVQADIRGACWVTPVDTPPAALATLDALLEAGAPALPVDPSGCGGHPVLLDADLVASIRRAPPEGGLRTLLGGARRVPVDDPTVGMDFDTPAAWEAYLALLTAHTGELEGPGSAR